MTSNVTNVAISLLCELQAGKEDRHEAVAREDGMEEFTLSKATSRRYRGSPDTRTADFKRLLKACTTLIVNES
jgi:hypothetical protein